MSIKLPNFQELYDIAKLEIQLKDTELNDFHEGSVLDVHCGSSAAVGFELVYQLSRIINAFYTNTSSGKDLDARVRDYNITRKASVAANNLVTLTRVTSTSPKLIYQNSTFICPIDGTEFYNPNDIVFNTGQTVVTAQLIAKIPGTASNVLANTIKTIVPNPMEIISITHLPFDNGVDEETDVELRSRFRYELSTMPRGTAPALITGALRHVGVTNAAVQRVFSGYTKLYIDTGSGSPPTQLIADIQSDIDKNWRAAGEKVEVIGAETFSINISGRISIAPEYVEETSNILLAVEEAIVEFLRSKKMGVAVYLSEIIKVVMSITGVVDFQITDPIQNIPGQASKIIRSGVINLVVT